jgi:acetolactate synthase small subunit
MNKNQMKHHYLVENVGGIFKSIRTVFDERRGTTKEELACFHTEMEAEQLIRDLVDHQNQKKLMDRKKKKLVDITK